MNLKTEILKENSRENWERISEWVAKDQQRFNEMLTLLFSKEKRLSQRTSQIMTTLADSFPEFYTDDVKLKLIQNLKTNPDYSVVRNTIRIFQFLDIPEEAEGDLFELGIFYLKSSETPIAVKAFSMTALRRICEKYPELASELIPHIEILVEEKASAGIVNRGKKELTQLFRLTN